MAASNLANVSAHDKLVNYVEHSDLSTKVAVESLKRPNVSILAPLFTASLVQSDTRLTKPEFTAAARQFIYLPPVSNGESTRMSELKCGCSTQICNSRKCQATNENLDAAGNHGLLCNPGVKAKRATFLERALENCYRKAGGIPSRQPATYSLLGEIFSKEDVARLFPGYLSLKESDKRKKLAMEYLDIINEIPRGAVRTAHLGMLRERFPEVKQVEDNDESNGIIRFDLKFPVAVPDEKLQELWIDHAIVQETCPTHATDCLKFLEEQDSNLPEHSPAFVKTYKGKARRYGALIDVVNRLTDERRLKSAPKFLFPIASRLR